jgi:hypothetical protein
MIINNSFVFGMILIFFKTHETFQTFQTFHTFQTLQTLQTDFYFYLYYENLYFRNFKNFQTTRFKYFLLTHFFPPFIQHSTFNVQCSMFNVQCSIFNKILKYHLIFCLLINLISTKHN